MNKKIKGEIMPTENNPNFKSKDGCIYIYNLEQKKWFKYCPVNELPIDIKKQVREIEEKAELLRDAT